MKRRVIAGLGLVLAAGAAWAMPARVSPPGVTRSSGVVRGHGPNGTPRGLAYTVVPVARPGRIEGVVTFRGTAPQLAAMPVPANANPAVCGSSTPNPGLVVDASSRGVANSVVYLADIARGAAPTEGTARLDQRGCVYSPHVIAATVGSTLRYRSSDPGVLHNVHAYYGLVGQETWFNRATLPGIEVATRVEREGIHRIGCDAGHTWMVGYVHAFDHPYYAVTDASGHYAIANVPPGTYRLHVWHEGWSVQGTDASGRITWSAPVEAETSVTVANDGALTANFEYDAAPSARAVPAPARPTR